MKNIDSVSPHRVEEPTASKCGVQKLFEKRVRTSHYTVGI
jgi:hypothetical protein